MDEIAALMGTALRGRTDEGELARVRASVRALCDRFPPYPGLSGPGAPPPPVPAVEGTDVVPPVGAYVVVAVVAAVGTYVAMFPIRAPGDADRGSSTSPTSVGSTRPG